MCEVRGARFALSARALYADTFYNPERAYRQSRPPIKLRSGRGRQDASAAAALLPCGFMVGIRALLAAEPFQHVLQVLLVLLDHIDQPASLLAAAHGSKMFW